MSSYLMVEVNKLLNIQNHLEKSIGSILVNIKKYQECCYIFELQETIQINCETDKSYLRSSIQNIFDELKKKENSLTRKNFIESTDFNIFKKEMIAIQDNINNFKIHVKSKIYSLQEEIHFLEEDVNFYPVKVVEWSKKVEINEHPSVSQYKQSATFIKHRVKEVQDFMDFLCRSKGHENGWRQEDHQMFLKFHNKFKNVDTLTANLNALLPDISVEEIKNHNEWYEKYLILKKKKKAAILKWQKSKNSKKPINHYNGTNSSSFIANGDFSISVQNKIQIWKAEKEEKITLARKIEEEQQMKERRKQEIRKKRNEEMKMIVNEWKQTKLEMEQHEICRKKLNEESERKHRAIEAKKLIKQFQSQDDLYIMKLRKYKFQKEMKVPVRTKSCQLASRDPDRLLKPTKQWINRIHDDNIYNSYTLLMPPIKKVPKLGVPEWRKTLENG